MSHLPYVPERRIISSLTNSTVKRWRDQLKNKDLIVLEGLHLLQRYHERYGAPEILILSSAVTPQAEILQWINATHLEDHVWQLSAAPLKQLSSLANPAPILGIVPSPGSPEELSCLNTFSSLWLDNVQDPGNMGTLLRTALGAGIKHIVCGEGCTDVWSPKVLRSAQGAHFYLTLWENIHLPELAQALPTLPKWGAAAHGKPYTQCSWPSVTALVLGNEGTGISPQLAPHLDQYIGIPLDPLLDSLNVAIAGAILLFHQKSLA